MNIVSIVSHSMYRLSLLLLTIFLTGCIWYAGFYNRPACDAIPNLKAVTPALYREWAKSSNIVKTGIYITNFSMVNMAENQFLMDAYIWLKFNPLTLSLDTVSQFSFDKGRMNAKDLIDAKKLNDDLQVRYRVQVEFVSVLNYKYYPFDSHRLYMVLRSDGVSPREILLTTDYTSTWFCRDALSYNWTYDEPATDYGFLEMQLDSRQPSKVDMVPASAIYFDFSRKDFQDAISIFLPLMCLMLLMLGSFLIAFTPAQAVGFSVVGILSAIVYRIIINGMSPKVVYYMLSDLGFIFVFLCACMICIFHSINAWYKDEEKVNLELLRGGELTISSIVFLVGWFFILCVW